MPSLWIGDLGSLKIRGRKLHLDSVPHPSGTRLIDMTEAKSMDARNLKRSLVGCHPPRARGPMIEVEEIHIAGPHKMMIAFIEKRAIAMYASNE